MVEQKVIKQPLNFLSLHIQQPSMCSQHQFSTREYMEQIDFHPLNSQVFSSLFFITKNCSYGYCSLDGWCNLEYTNILLSFVLVCLCQEQSQENHPYLITDFLEDNFYWAVFSLAFISVASIQIETLQHAFGQVDNTANKQASIAIVKKHEISGCRILQTFVGCKFLVETGALSWRRY